MGKNLSEGMRANDLEDTVLALISVDEFVSKIDDDAIVIGFYVADEDAANDLVRFIQRTPVEILDTDMSPAPDSAGNFMVFVELLPDDKFAWAVKLILEEVSAITGLKAWKMKIRTRDREEAFDATVLAKEFAGSAEKQVSGSVNTTESVYHYLSASMLNEAVIQGDTLVLTTGATSSHYQIAGFGEVTDLLREHKLEDAPLAATMRDTIRAANLAAALGKGWSVYRIGEHDLLLREGYTAGLLLRS
jgi:hypothetical protein